MKLIKFGIVICSLLTLSQWSWGDWIQDGGSISNNTNPALYYPSIASNNNIPYVSWQEPDGAYQIYVKHFSGNTWVQDAGSLNINTTSNGGGPKIAFVGTTPYVAWTEYASVWRIYVKHYNGSNWLSDGSGSLNINDNYYGIDPSIAILGSVPYVTWSERNASGKFQIYVKHLSGTTWIQDGLELNIDTAQEARAPDISCSATAPYVAWYETKAGTNQINVKHFNGAAWIADGASLNNNALKSAQYPSLMMSANIPYVAFQEQNLSDVWQVYVKCFNGTSWIQLGNALNNLTAQNAQYPRIAFAGAIPYVTWIESVGNTVDIVYVKHFDAGSNQWVADGDSLNLDSTKNAQTPRIAINNQTPYVVWQETNVSGGEQFYVKHIADSTPSVFSCYPKNAVKDNVLPNVLIEGYNLNAPVAVKLIRTDNAASIVNGFNIVRKKGTVLSCGFDLTNAAPGFYNVQVESGTLKGVLKRGFLIQERGVLPAQWAITDIGNVTKSAAAGSLCGISVEDGDNDGVQELFLANRNPTLFRAKKMAGGWSISAVGQETVGELYLDTLICDPANNGMLKVYGTTSNSYLYQYSGITLDKSNFGTSVSPGYRLCIGDGFNDGWFKIFMAAGNGHIYQFPQNGNQNKDDLLAGVGTMNPMNSVAVGDGNLDGGFEVYGASSDHSIYQFVFNGTAWDKTVVGAGGGEMYAVTLADIDNDGGMEVYGANEDGAIYQFKWGFSAWQKNQVGTCGGKLFDLTINDGDNTGAVGIYAACADGHVYQFKPSGTQWIKMDLSGTSTPLYKIAAGDGDNDNLVEIYAIGDNGHVFQFKMAAILNPTPTPIPDFRGQIISANYVFCAPNPARGSFANLNIFTQQPAHIDVKIFTPGSQLVFSFTRDYADIGKHIERIDLHDLANGVYFILVKARNEQGAEEKVTYKMIWIK